MLPAEQEGVIKFHQVFQDDSRHNPLLPFTSLADHSEAESLHQVLLDENTALADRQKRPGDSNKGRLNATLLHYTTININWGIKMKIRKLKAVIYLGPHPSRYLRPFSLLPLVSITSTQISLKG